MNNKLVALYNLEFGELPYMPDRQWTDDEISQAILEGKPIEELFLKDNEGEQDMEEQKIRKLLKQYGAEDVEIENFMTDLKDMKDEAEEENLLIANADKLKATQEGREIIKNAPTMAKDELAKKIKEFLQ